MSYSQTYGQPPVLSNPTVETNLCAWPDPVFCGSSDSGPRGTKRRVNANRKERRRTMSINNAFAELRDCIPNVPPDTKLSKIKILKLSTSYIEHLTELLSTDQSCCQTARFKTEVVTEMEPQKTMTLMEATKVRKVGGRTGWPQHVWALELKHENPS